MVRLSVVLKRSSIFFATVVYLAMQLTFLQTLLIKPPIAKADTFQRTLVSSSSGNTSRFISLRDMALQRGNISWPTRNYCNPAGSSTQYKTSPYYANQPNGGYSGNFMDGNGDCATRYTDGGWNVGAWFSPDAFGGWARGTGVVSLGPVPGSGPDSSKMNNCRAFPSQPQKKWGAGPDNLDQAYGSSGLFARNGRNVSVETINGSNIYLYSHGTTLFRANFTLSSADLAAIQNGTYYTAFLGVADDWLRVYVNGIQLVSESDSAQTQVRIGFSNAIKNSLVVGTNSIAIQASDKAVWSGSPTNPGRGAGLCYELALYSVDAVDVCPGMPGIQTDPSLCPPPTSSPVVGCAVVPIGTPEAGQAFNSTVSIGASPGTYTGGTATLSVVPNPGTPSGGISINPSGPVSLPDITGFALIPSPPNSKSITIANRGSYRVQWTISGGNAANIPPPCSATIEVVAKPYFRVTGGDVQASANSCGGLWSGVTPGAGAIYAWHSRSPLSGAGTDLAAMAVQQIEQFASGGGVNPREPKRLTFANTGVGAGGSTYGGGASVAECPHTYREPGSYTGSVGPTLSSPVLSSDGVLSGGTGLTIAPASQLTITKDAQVTIYVKGDVRINRNIVYDTSSPWAIGSIPSLTIIAEGDIFIDQSVTTLDGTYVARGTIYTCAVGGSAANATQVRDNCTNTLTINGSLIARAVKLLRSRGSMSNATAAEVFNYRPESWLVGPPGLSSGLDFTVDSIQNLPPVL